MPTYNVAVPVVELLDAAGPADALDRLRQRLERAGFTWYEGTVDTAGGDAFESDVSATGQRRVRS